MGLSYEDRMLLATKLARLKSVSIMANTSTDPKKVSGFMNTVVKVAQEIKELCAKNNRKK